MNQKEKQRYLEAALCAKYDVGRLMAFRLVYLWRGGKEWDTYFVADLLNWCVRHVEYMSADANIIIRMNITERNGFKAGCNRRHICGKQWLRLDAAILKSYER